MKNTKKSLMTSVMSLLLCFAMLLGTTYAWFTDTAVSANNIIQSGELDIAMYWNDDLTGAWKNIENENTIFDYDKWEPGYTEVKYIKIVNEGNLAFKYDMRILPMGEVSKLADVIDVYYIEEPQAPVNKTTDLKTPVGNLSKVIAGGFDTSGKMTEAGEELVVAIALKMREDAGNEYMGLSIGDSFSIQLIAAQLSYEEDSFGKDYDKDATFPDAPVHEGVTAPVENENGQAKNDVALNGENASATVPAGAKLEDGATQLTLTVTELNESNANITLGENEEKKSIDVHIEGIAATNDKPIVISLGAIAPIGQNEGNFKLYHVENAQSVEMTRVASPSELTAHNTFYYDPATGEVTVAMATFSEVALVADTVNEWEGNFDYSWYTNAVAPVDGEAVTEYTIANADQLAAFGAIVGGMDGQTQDSFAGKTVKLIADINLGDKESENNPNIIFYPIGYYNSEGTYERTNTAITSGLRNFEGTFDGNGHTIANFYHNTWEMKGDHNWYSPEEQYYRDGMGLFGRVYKGTVKNLTVKNFSSDGEIATTGVIAAYADGATFENIAITDCNPRVYNIGNGGIVGCVGWYAKEAGLKTTFKNITVDNSNKISALWGSYDVACGGIVGQYYPTSGQTSAGTPKNAGIELVNCHVSAQMDVYNDVCANYQYYAYRYAGMIIGSIRENTTNEDGKTIPDMTGISATGCTVNYGDWNDYYYCEFEKNGHPSYSGPDDYKFSRVPHSELNFTDSNGNGLVDADERASVTGCKHNHTAKEDNKAIYLPFHQLFTGYGWGVNSIGLKEYSGIVTDLGITEGDQQESVEKFEKADNAPETYRPGQTINVGDLFKEIAGIKVPVVSSSVYVSVSPVTENDKGSAIYTADTNDWSNGTITFADDCVGALKIIITDYFFCTKTAIILNAETAQEKFTAKPVDVQNAYTQINLGNLFTANAIKQDVTATVLVDGNAFATINGTTADWASKTIDLTKDGKYTVTIKENDDFCEATTVEFTVNKVDKFESKFTGDFLYRVGNANTVAWTSLFADLIDTIAPQNLNVTVVNVKGNATGTFTNGAIKFTGTGVVEVTISADGANSVELQLEVVNATNVAENGKIGNYNTTSVLLGNTSISTLYLNGGATLYGNGFIIDCTNSPFNGSGSVSENYIIALVDAHLDNVVVKGKVYTQYGAMASDAYNRALVVTKGTSTITNCYLSNTASPIRLVEGSLYVKGTTVKGGNFANIDVRNGHLTVEDVTTINQALGNDKADDGSTVIGLGIVVYYENVDTSLTEVTINGTLTQYNHISSNDKFTHEYATTLVSEMMNSDYADYRTEINGVKWVNPGFVGMTAIEPTDSRTDKVGYIGKDISFMSVKGYVYAAKPTSESIKVTPDEYKTIGQGAIAPAVSFDYTNKNYVAKTEGSNDYCYYDNGKVLISMDQGDTFSWDPFILTATKFGETLNYTVAMNGKTYANGEKITFNASGEYVVTYTYTDNSNYTVDENGELVSKPEIYTKTVNISVSVIKPTAQHATFTFADTNTATEKVTVGDKTYISASGVSATDKEWGYITVNSTKIFYPITEAHMKTSNKLFGGKETQVYYYVFKDTVTITDYKDGGTGGAQIYNSETTSMPSNLTVVNGMEAKYTAISSACVDVSKLTKKGEDGEVWDFSASTTVSGTTTYNNYLAHSSPSGLEVKSGKRDYDAITVAQFSYTDAAGATYYYFVGYFMPNQNTSDSGSSGGGTCLAEGSMITLADGSKKAVEELRKGDVVMAFDHVTGEIVYKDIVLVGKTYADSYYKNVFVFDDDTELTAINSHGIYDLDLNMYVNIGDLNYQDYLGHRFASVDVNGNISVKRLVDVVTTVESGYKYDIVTNETLNYVVEDTLSVSHEIVDIMNSFAFGDDMVYDADAMQEDIAEYGLYTYADFAEYCDLATFEKYNMAMMKVGVGKGLYTYEHLVYLLTEIALNDNVQIVD